MSLTMTDRVAEEFRLLSDAGKFSIRDHGSQIHDSTADGDDEDGSLTVLFVKVIDLSFQLDAPLLDGGLQVGNFGVVALSVVGDVAGRSLGHIERKPRGLHEQSQIRVMLQTQFGEFRDPLIGKLQVRGHREDIDLTVGQRSFRFVLVVGQVPVLDDSRAADPLRINQLVPLNARRLDDLFDLRWHEHVKTVAGVEDPLTSGDLRVLGRCDAGADRRQHERDSDERGPAVPFSEFAPHVKSHEGVSLLRCCRAWIRVIVSSVWRNRNLWGERSHDLRSLASSRQGAAFSFVSRLHEQWSGTCHQAPRIDRGVFPRRIRIFLSR